MLKQHEVIIPEKRKRTLDAVICDLCKKEYMYATDYGGCQSISWEHGFLDTAVYFFKESSRELDYFTGEVEVVPRKSVTYHICPVCFEQKLEPWLKENGAVPTIE